MNNYTYKNEQLLDSCKLYGTILYDRPKIAIIADIKGWAFDNIAKSIHRNLSNRYDINILYIEDFADYVSMFTCVFSSPYNYDIIHCLWRESANSIDVLQAAANIAHEKNARNISPCLALSRLAKTRITVSVYDHLLSDPEHIHSRRWSYSNLYSGYTVSSSRLCDIYTNYSNLGFIPEPSIVIEDGVDISRFIPNKLSRFSEDRQLIVGWVGNSKWHADGVSDPKGLHTILKPAITLLQSEGIQILGKYADRQDRLIPQDEMPIYYSSIDVLVCASAHEGTPNPILEAMACGLPFISTDVGIVKGVAGPKQSEFVLSERSVIKLADALRKIALNRSLLSELSHENLSRIRNFTREIEAEKWDKFFQKILSIPPRPILTAESFIMVEGLVFDLIRRHDAQISGLRKWIDSNEQMIIERDALLRQYERQISQNVKDQVSGNKKRRANFLKFFEKIRGVISK
jgi:glycosyltransferase involved in cell wall biosynthesis